MIKKDELTERLQEIGLGNGESRIYLILLETGTTKVKTITEKSHMHRTGIYDFLNKLLNKGLVTYNVIKNTRYYTAVPPEKLIKIIEEKQKVAETILPSLLELGRKPHEEFSVETNHGVEAIKNLFNDILRYGEDYVCINVDEEEWDRRFPHITRVHMRKEKSLGLSWKAITRNDSEFTYESSHSEYRYLPKEHFGPMNTVIYGTNIAIIVHEPLTVITIRNKPLAEAYKKHFTFLWDIAKTSKGKK